MPLALFLLHFHDYSNGLDSPFIVPVAGCLMVLGIVIAGMWSGARKRQIESEERLAAIARGVPVPPTVEELAMMHGKPSLDATRRRANIRLAGIILVAASIGLALFFVILWAVIGERNILCGVAVALIPFGIGAGLLFDTHIQTREMEEATHSNNSITPTH
ncbi:hypothetical protein GOB94_07605 [Granulicella sp. 5B5]|uniref:hypothetical protein n=1 Tax=Granulicella sp. 5B5 TaxID=1617967 RepID=UPI0015F43CF4|nr:hypothetical protein [Granulicella sp. 5B5]QMV18566.1 hypothetical protein GOB94_07605 [Granulicella sp. 5B5]